MKSLFKLMAIGCIASLFSCQSGNDVYSPNTTPKETSTFNFETSQDVKLNVTYATATSVPFSVYAENPVEITRDSAGTPVRSKKTDVLPIYSGMTNTDGTFSKTLTLPQYATTLYVESPAFYVENVMEASVSGNTASATESSVAAVSKVGVSRASAPGKSVSSITFREGKNMNNWSFPLGTFNDYTGIIDYPYTEANSSLVFTKTQIKNFYSEIPNVVCVDEKNCAAKYLSSQDLVVDKDEVISITMLGGNTCWNSSLGYYYYTGNAPTDKSKIKVFTLFPNTQDGTWKNSPDKGQPTGLARETVALLQYFGPDYTSTATTTFPAGTKVGFVLACNAWPESLFSSDRKGFYSYTTPGLSTTNYYKNTVAGSTFYPYKNVNTAFANDEDGTIVCFEDHNDDHNCSDVLFALKPQFNSNNIQNVYKEKTTDETVNTYAFEDQWPEDGACDYDMNDVIVYGGYSNTMSAYDKTETSTTNTYNITNEYFTFTTDQNHSNKTALNNGLAVWFQGTGLTITVKYKKANGTEFTDYTGFTKEEENGNTYLYLTSNVKTDMGGEYQVTINHHYQDGVTTQTKSGCFLYRDDNSTKGHWEVHIPYEAPTSKLSDYYRNYIVTDKPYAATANDNSVFYPFAIKLTGVNASGIAKLLDANNESKRIDAIYSDYSNWYKSGGTSYTGWYMK